MRKLKMEKFYESGKVDGNLSKLCNIRNAIAGQDKERTESLISIFNHEFNEIDYEDLFVDNDRIYVIQTASNKFIEVDKEDMEKFTF